MKKILPYAAVAAAAALMLVFPGKTMHYAAQSMDMCRDIIVPALFPFFVCSGLLIYSGFFSLLADWCRPVMKPLFNVNGSGAAAFVLGIISGYPLGATTACGLYRSGYLSKTETERLLAFCNNSGPLFVMGAVGTAIYSSAKIGIVLYAAHILAAVTVGILFRFYKKNRHTAPIYRVKTAERSFPEVFSEVLTNSVGSIMTVCGAVIFFGAAANVIADFLPENLVRTLFLAAAELTAGTKSISESGLSLAGKLTLSAFAAGFAGVCVHLQVIAAAAGQGLDLKPYIVGKILHGLFAAVYTRIYFGFFPPSETVFSETVRSVGAGFCMSAVYTAVGAVFIAVLSAMLVTFGIFSVKAVKFAQKNDR